MQTKDCEFLWFFLCFYLHYGCIEFTSSSSCFFQLSDSKKIFSLNPADGQRAVLIKNQQGDWGLLRGQWTGFRKHQPAVAGNDILGMVQAAIINVCHSGELGYLVLILHLFLFDCDESSQLSNPFLEPTRTEQSVQFLAQGNNGFSRQGLNPCGQRSLDY